MTAYLGLPSAGGDLRQTAAVVNRINQGKLNCSGTVVLTTGATTTIVEDPRVGPDSFIGLAPLTATAAAEMAGGALYIQGRSRGNFTVAHSSGGSPDRTFTYLVLG
jgi:hypothetical protein